MKRIVSTDDAPAAVGAYSQATTTGDLLFTAGQVALTADGEALDDAPIEVQTEQVLYNIDAVLDDQGLSTDDVLKTTVYLADIDDYEAMNEVYAEYFDREPPARSAFAVEDLPKGFAVEIEAVADASDD
jgi:reactive intermediate/imine deaminase